MRIVRLVLTFVALAVGAVVVAAPAHAYPAGVIATAAINKTLFTPGDTVIVTVRHTTPGPMTMQLFSAPVTIGTGTVSADSTGSVSGQIPPGYSGTHTIQVDGNGGEIFSFVITVTTGTTTPPTGLPCTGPPTARVIDRHSIAFSQPCVAPDVSFTLTDGPWSASINGRSGVATDRSHLLPLGTSTVRFVGRESTGTVVQRGSFEITIGAPTTPTPTPTVTATGGTRGSGGGELASTGAQVGLGLGAGLAAVLAGGVVLVAARRRTARH